MKYKSIKIAINLKFKTGIGEKSKNKILSTFIGELKFKI